MKKRYHLFIITGILLVGFIIGSFLDFKIDEALFNKNNGFGLFMASFGVYPCYAGLAFVGGGLMCTSIRRKDLKTWLKICCYGLSALAYVMAIYLCGKELPSVNGYNVPQFAILSYAICAVVFAGCYVGGYLACLKGDQAKLWRVLMVMTVIFVVALLPAGFLIKLVIHRPRYRLYVESYNYDVGNQIPFCNWWQSYKSYKDFLANHGEGFKYPDGFLLTKEEFKSFPSGHSGTGMIMAMFLPFAAYFFPKLKGKETMLFYIGAVWGFVMMFSRMLVGAHYLTDTCMGSLIVMVVFYVVNEFAVRKGFFDDQKQEEKPAEPQEEPQPAQE